MSSSTDETAGTACGPRCTRHATRTTSTPSIAIIRSTRPLVRTRPTLPRSPLVDLAKLSRLQIEHRDRPTLTVTQRRQHTHPLRPHPRASCRVVREEADPVIRVVRERERCSGEIGLPHALAV